MVVMCQIVRSDRGYEGVIQDAKTGRTVFKTDFEGCAEDADAAMESTILRNRWQVVPNPIR